MQAGSFRGARQLDTPLTVNVIPNALIQSQQAQSLLDALRNTAGVSPSQITTTVYSNIAIRGINVENRSNYRLNGILPIVNLVDLPLEDKDRVEALKGASALYYGFTTPAGIVNLTMKRPTPDPYLAATLFGNEYGALGGHVDASNTWGLFGARVNAVYGSVDSGIDNTRGHRSLARGGARLQAERQRHAEPGRRAHPETRQRARRVPLHPAAAADADRTCTPRCSCRRCSIRTSTSVRTGPRIAPRSAISSPP